MICVTDLDVGCTVARIPASQLSPLVFQREFVSRNKPVVITGAILESFSQTNKTSGPSHISRDFVATNLQVQQTTGLLSKHGL